jgi:hypothetical protein
MRDYTLWATDMAMIKTATKFLGWKFLGQEWLWRTSLDTARTDEIRGPSTAPLG